MSLQILDWKKTPGLAVGFSTSDLGDKKITTLWLSQASQFRQVFLCFEKKIKEERNHHRGVIMCLNRNAKDGETIKRRKIKYTVLWNLQKQIFEKS